MITVVVIIDPPRGKRWRKIFVNRFGGSENGILVTNDVGLANTASFVIERLGGKTLVLEEGEELGLVIGEVTDLRLFLSDVVIRFVRFNSLIFPRQLFRGTLVALFPDPQLLRRFLDLEKPSISRACRIDTLATTRPRRRIDRVAIDGLLKTFIRSANPRIFKKAGIDIDEFVNSWARRLSA